MAQAFTDPRGRFFDKNGDPLRNGIVELYVAGSETKAKAYEDYEFQVEATWPLTLNNAGQVNETGIFLGDGLFKVVVKSYIGTDEHGVKQYKLEHSVNGVSGNEIPGILASGFTNVTNVVDLRTLTAGAYAYVYCMNHSVENDDGGGWFVYDASSSYGDDNGTVIAPLGAPVYGRFLRKFNGIEPTIRMWGANSTAANVVGNLTNAIDYASRENKTLHWPAGTYSIGDAALNVNEGVHVIAEGCVIESTDTVDFTGAIFSSESLSLIADNLIVSETLTGHVRPEWWGVERNGTSMQGAEFLKCITNSTEPVLCSDRYLIGDTILDNGRAKKTTFKFIQYGQLDTIGDKFVFMGDVVNDKVNGEPVVTTAFHSYIELYGDKYYTSDFGITNSTHLYNLCLTQSELITIYTDAPISFSRDLDLGGSIITFDFCGDGQWILNGYNVTIISMVQQSIIRLIPHNDSLVSIRDMKTYKANMFGGNIPTYHDACWEMLITSASAYGKIVNFEDGELTVGSGVTVDVNDGFSIINGNISFSESIRTGLRVYAGAGTFKSNNMKLSFPAPIDRTVLGVNSDCYINNTEVTNGHLSAIIETDANFMLNNTVNFGNLAIRGSVTQAILGGGIVRGNYISTDGSMGQGKILIQSQDDETVSRGLLVEGNIFAGEITEGTPADKVRIDKSGSWENIGNNQNTANSHSITIRNNVGATPNIEQYIPATQGSFKMEMFGGDTDNLINGLGGTYDAEIDLSNSLEFLYGKVFTFNDEAELGYFNSFDLTDGLFWYETEDHVNSTAFKWMPIRHDLTNTTFTIDQTIGQIITDRKVWGIRLPTVAPAVAPTQGYTATANINFRLYDGNVVYFKQSEG